MREFIESTLKELTPKESFTSPASFKLNFSDNYCISGNIINSQSDGLILKVFVEETFVETFMEVIDGRIWKLETSYKVESFTQACLAHWRIALNICEGVISIKSLIVSLFSEYQPCQILIFALVFFESDFNNSRIAIFRAHYLHLDLFSCILIDDLERRFVSFLRRRGS